MDATLMLIWLQLFYGTMEQTDKAKLRQEICGATRNATLVTITASLCIPIHRDCFLTVSEEQQRRFVIVLHEVMLKYCDTSTSSPSSWREAFEMESLVMLTGSLVSLISSTLALVGVSLFVAMLRKRQRPTTGSLATLIEDAAV